ncbi:MAG TPA: alcohol dehydrogenase catalytic domain-containing protein [Nitrososphaeraceae archaeon]|nr:alcohol dehydrogenase catalytic domain-containing protein [Nitrososphaeraceae archaeon]
MLLYFVVSKYRNYGEQLHKIENGLLVGVNTCAVSAYDARIFKRGCQEVRPPVVFGHELCGEVPKAVTLCNGKVIQSCTRTAAPPLISCLSCNTAITRDTTYVWIWDRIDPRW